MIYTIKIGVLIILANSLTSCIIKGSSPSNSRVVTMRVDTIYEGGFKDIAFKQFDGKMAYINRGLENGLTLEGMRSKVLNKTITLHLSNTIIGTSNHIAQVVVENDTLYTEFK